MTTAELVTLACCDLGAIVRGRAVFATDLDEHLRYGVGWVPANHALTPIGPVAEPNPFGSVGDLRLLPDPDTRIRVGPDPETDSDALELLLCDIVETDGVPWECCPRRALRATLDELDDELGVTVRASFEHEFQLISDEPSALPFSLEAQRRCGPFAGRAMAALLEAGVEPERFFAEYASHQFEIPVAPAEGLASADRAVLVREVVREVARRGGERASFVPLLDPDEAGNGVHIHFALLGADGHSALHDPAAADGLSELGGRFAAGVLLHARALSALTAPSPVSAARLAPHRWSAGAVALARRNREALLRMPPVVTIGGLQEAPQLHLEYRAADASANPHLALAAILQAGLDGVRRELPAPPILDRDPAQLDTADAERFGVGALPTTLDESLQALAEDDAASAWLPPLLLEAHMAIKRFELAATARLDVGEICRRYAAIY
jgi:glutamine synthetase